MQRTVSLFAALGLSIAPLAAQEFSTGQAARLVIGQKPFTAQDPGASERLLGALSGIAHANGALVVADANRMGASPVNHRVVVFRNLPQVVGDVRGEFPQDDPRCPACIGIASSVLGQPDFEEHEVRAPAQNTMRTPIGVAYNGRFLAVADTDNNRVLVWRGLPATNEAPADFVVGQPDFTSFAAARFPGRGTLRGPQGVWLDANDGLWVADTLNNRVLYYGEITRNGQEPTLVLGQPDFGTNDQGSIAEPPKVRPDTMLNPIAVTTDGTRLYVTDLGLSRILIWNSIPTQNRQPADVAVGQKDLTTFGINNAREVCEPVGETEEGEAIYPVRCAATLSLPRFAISDGRRLYVSDSGNDRVLVFNEIPLESGARADVILGQPNEYLNMASDSAEPDRVSSTDSFKTPHSLALDGTNLYVSDTFNRRVLVYTPADFALPIGAVRNAASPFVFAQGTITFTGDLVKDDEITLTIGRRDLEDSERQYKITVEENWDFATLVGRFVELINRDDGDPFVVATPNVPFQTIILTARDAGPLGNQVTLAYTNSNTASLTLITVSGSTLTGGQESALIAPYSLVTIVGDDMTDFTSELQPLDQPLPYSLANTQVFFDGKLAPLVLVSPDRIVAQMPVDVTGSRSASGIVRTIRSDGRVTVSTPVAVRLIEQNPGVFHDPDIQPNPGLAFHFSSAATGTISVDGAPNVGDRAIVIINGREYTHVVEAEQTNLMVRDALVQLINENDPEVEAFRGGIFATRVRLRARVPGPIGNGIPIAVRTTDAGGVDNAGVLLFATNSTLCCANEAGAPITGDNPALPGETIVVFATGLGLTQPDDARYTMFNGLPYDGPEYNEVVEFVSSLAGGRTANVLFSGLKKGLVGVYEVHLELNADIPTNPRTQVHIAQSFQVSNIFTIPVVNPRPPEDLLPLN